MPIFFSEPKNLDNVLTGTFENVDYFYARGKNIKSISIAGFGVSPLLSNTSIFKDNTADGYDYLLYGHDSKVASAEFTATFNTDAEIDRALFLEKLFEFDDDEFQRIDMGQPERGAIIQEDLYYDLSKIKGYFKRYVGYTAEAQSLDKLREFEVFRMSDEAVHFMFLEDFEHFPNRLYHALLEPELDVRYNILVKSAGVDPDFVIRER